MNEEREVGLSAKEKERQWLDQLADGLAISGVMRKFLEEEV